MRKNQILINKISDQNILTGVIKTKEGTTVVKASVRLDFSEYETTTWTPGTEKSEGDRVIATIDNNHEYGCVGDGETGSEEPIWPTGGGNVSDGDLLWVDLGLYDRSSLLENVSFFYHCNPGNIDAGALAFCVDDVVLVAEEGSSYFIIGFADLKPRSCEVTVLAGTGLNAHVGRSVDTGLTWEDMGSQFADRGVLGISGLGASRMVIAGIISGASLGGNIIRSIDKGLTWSNLGTFGVDNMNDTADLGGGVCLACGGPPAKVFKSIDYGATWNLAATLSVGSISQALSLSYKDGLCFACTYDYDDEGPRNKGAIFRSINYGATWQSVYESAEEESWWFEEVLYLGDGIALAGGGFWGNIFRSTNYGITWAPTRPTAYELYIVELADCGDGVCLAGGYSNANIWRSTNYGASWINVGSYAGITHMSTIEALGGGVIVAGGSPGGKIIRSVNNGVDWTDMGGMFGEFGVLDLHMLSLVN